MNRRSFLLALPQVTSACSIVNSEPRPNDPASQSMEQQLQPSSNKTLVAYFSGTETTKAVADEIVRLLGADQLRILAAQPYASNPYDDQA